MKRSLILGMIFIFICSNLVLGIAYQELPNSKEDNDVIIFADFQINYTKTSDDPIRYSIDANFTFISNLDLAFELRLAIYKNETCDTLEKLKILMDIENASTNPFPCHSIRFGDEYHYTSKLYNDKSIGAGFYGAVCYIISDDTIWRKVGLLVEVGSIIITKVYTTKTIELDDESTIEWTLIGPVTTHWEALNFPVGGTNYISSNSAANTTDILSMEYYNLTLEQDPSNETSISLIKNITVRFLAGSFENPSNIWIQIEEQESYHEQGWDIFGAETWHENKFEGFSLTSEAINSTDLGIVGNDGGGNLVFVKEVVLILGIETNNTNTLPISISSSSSGSRTLDAIEEFIIDWILVDEIRNTLLWITGMIGGVAVVIFGLSKHKRETNRTKGTINYKINRWIHKAQKAIKTFKN